MVVMTFNVLAPVFVGDSFACPLKFLEWRYRLRLILRDIDHVHPHILLLQEVEHGAYCNDLLPALRRFGYEGVFGASPQAANSHGVGVCTFWRCDTVEAVSIRRLPLGTIIASPAFLADAHTALPRTRTETPLVRVTDESATDACTGRCADLVASAIRLWHCCVLVHLRLCRSVCACDGTCGCTRTEELAGGTAVSIMPSLVVGNVHCHWDPRHPDVKALQALAASTALHELAESITGPTIQILGGDLNSRPVIEGPDLYYPHLADSERMASGVYQLLSTGSLHRQHADHPAAVRGGKVCMSDLHIPHPDTAFTSAYCETIGEPAWTNWHNDFRATLDYIWYRVTPTTFPSIRDASSPQAALGTSGGCHSSTSEPCGLSGACVRPHARDASAGMVVPSVALSAYASAALDVPEEASLMRYAGCIPGGCPNEGIGSDHIPLAVKLVVSY